MKTVMIVGLLVFGAATGLGHPTIAHCGTIAHRKTVLLWNNRGIPKNSGAPVPGTTEKLSRKGTVSGILKPRIVILEPKHPNGTAVLILGGGGYEFIEMKHEAYALARFLSQVGITPVILYYRLPGDGWAPIAPFQDGQRAIRLLRIDAATLHIKPNRIGIVGFSAGGNLAGILGTWSDHLFYKPRGRVGRQSPKPDFVGLVYAVGSVEPPYTNTHTSKEMARQVKGSIDYTIANHVSEETPPVFIAHAENDPIANIKATLVLYGALVREGVPAELHIFDRGKHGWGLGRHGTDTTEWPCLFLNWLTENDLLRYSNGSVKRCGV